MRKITLYILRQQLIAQMQRRDTFTQVRTAQWTQITYINTEGVQYRAHVESDEQTEESQCFSEGCIYNM